MHWQEEINKYLKVKKDFSKKKNLIRYNSIGEIDITIKSILKFAPFINKILLVTDNQKPQSFPADVERCRTSPEQARLVHPIEE